MSDEVEIWKEIEMEVEVEIGKEMEIGKEVDLADEQGQKNATDAWEKSTNLKAHVRG